MVFESIKKSIVTIIFGVVTVLLFSACGGSKQEQIAAVDDRKDIPSLDATTVSTVVSDSGITRYRMSAEKWLVYDKAEEPYWDFPEGILLENFNTELAVDASVVSDYAIFYEKKQIWELKGNVNAMNLEGEHFETEHLFWNQKTERIYSDSLITITRASSVIVGVGFDSNQSLTKYEIKNPHGVFPLKDSNDSTVATEPIEVDETPHTELTEPKPAPQPKPKLAPQIESAPKNKPVTKSLVLERQLIKK